MNSPLLNWIYGIALLLALPLGLLVLCSSGSFFTALLSVPAVISIALLACGKDIVQDYKDSDKSVN